MNSVQQMELRFHRKPATELLELIAKQSRSSFLRLEAEKALLSINAIKASLNSGRVRSEMVRSAIRELL